MDNHINFKEAWDEGYQEYRDYARQELQNGYQRHIKNPASLILPDFAIVAF